MRQQRCLQTRPAGVACLACLIGALSSGEAPAAERLKAIPYRPTISNPAALSAPGHLEVEAGFHVDRKADNYSRRSSVPVLLKYAFTENAGVLLDGEFGVREHAAGSTTTGIGDTALIGKFRFPLTKDWVAGVEAGASFPTASHDLGEGKAAYLVNGILSWSRQQWSVDLYAGLTRHGMQEPEQHRLGTSWAGAISYAINDRWTFAAEYAGTGRRGPDDGELALFAASYRLRPTLVLDAGGAMRLSGAAPDRAFFVGVTWLVH